MSNELARYEESAGIQISRAPEQVLAEAQEAAKSLIKVIAMKPQPVMFNKEIYLEFEDWQTVAKFYGCTVKVEGTTFVEFGTVKGFECVAIVLDRNQNEVSRAESMCLDDEENWGAVPKYEWKDKLDAKGKKIWVAAKGDKKGHFEGERIQVGTVAKPLFQLRSMAQTRACARALRQVFAWVVVLAGYKPTVAEEMTGNELPSGGSDPEPERKPVPEIQRRSDKAAAGLPPLNSKPAAKPEPSICGSCGVVDGHDPSCKYAKPEDGGAGDGKSDADEGPILDAPKEGKAEAWAKYAGHDPKVHISFKQGGLLFVVQSKMGISDEDFKEWLKAQISVEHRPLIPKTHFGAILDAIDPDFKYHEAPGGGR